MAGLLDFLGGGGDQSDPAAERARQAQLGLAAGLLSQGYSRLPQGFGEALGKGLLGMMAAQQGYDKSALERAQIPLYGAQAGLYGAQSQLANAKVNYYKNQMGGGGGNTLPPMYLPGAAGASAAPAGNDVSSPGGLSATDIYGHLISIGASPNEAALLTSAANNESSFRPDISHDGGIGYGLFGHNGERLKNMQTAAGTEKPGWQDQLQFSLNELRGRPEGQLVNAAKTPEALTDLQMQFEQPNRNINNGNYAQRLAATAQYMAHPPLQQMAQATPTTMSDASPEEAYRRENPQGILGPPGGFVRTPQGDLTRNGQQPDATLPGSVPAWQTGFAPGVPLGVGMSPKGVPQGIFPMPAPAAAPPSGGLLAQVGQNTPAPASPPVAPPQPGAGQLVPGGGAQINPAYIDALQRRANAAAVLGETVPEWINKGATLPFVGPTTAAQEAAKLPYDLYAKWHSPMDVRVNGLIADPSTGRVVLRNPAVPEGYTVGQGPNGPVAEEVPGALAGISKSEAAKKTGGYQAEFGSIPGTQLGGASGSQSSQPEQSDQPVTISNHPIALLNGVTMPPISQQFMPQSPGELEHALPAWQKKTDEWNAGIAPARQAEMRLGTILQAFQMTETGAYETHKAELGALLKGLGIDPSLVMQTKPDAVQMALHDNILTTLPLLKAATPKPTQIEFMTTSENREHPNIQPAANVKMLSEDLALVHQAQQLPLAWNLAQQQGWRNPQSFEAAWSQLNPLDKTRDQIEQTIGPTVKGMPGNNSNIPAGATPAGTYQGKPVYKMPDGSMKVLQ